MVIYKKSFWRYATSRGRMAFKIRFPYCRHDFGRIMLNAHGMRPVPFLNACLWFRDVTSFLWCVGYGLSSSRTCFYIDASDSLLWLTSTRTHIIPDASEKDVTSQNQTHKIKSNRRFNALANEVQNTFDTKHKTRPTHYKDTMRPQQAIRSNTEHICTTMFIRRRILRVLPFVTRTWQPHMDSIPGCFIRPQTHIHTWKLEWSNYVNTSAHSAAGQRRALVRSNTNQFSSQTD